MPKFLSNEAAREAVDSIRQSQVDCARVVRDAAMLGRAIRERREALGFSVEEVAWCTDMQVKTISEIENGNEYFGLRYWLLVANVLGVDFLSCERASDVRD